MKKNQCRTRDRRHGLAHIDHAADERQGDHDRDGSFHDNFSVMSAAFLGTLREKLPDKEGIGNQQFGIGEPSPVRGRLRMVLRNGRKSTFRHAHFVDDAASVVIGPKMTTLAASSTKPGQAEIGKLILEDY